MQFLDFFSKSPFFGSQDIDLSLPNTILSLTHHRLGQSSATGNNTLLLRLMLAERIFCGYTPPHSTTFTLPPGLLEMKESSTF